MDIVEKRKAVVVVSVQKRVGQSFCNEVGMFSSTTNDMNLIFIDNFENL